MPSSERFRFRHNPHVANEKLKPGEWQWTGEPDFQALTIACPDCEKLSTLQRRINGSQEGHQVLAGLVHPSVVCPHKGCGFHEWAELEGW